ncbi:hypothetical protein [Arthrobacter sp. UYCu511]|uniref:hypothetical protein n=1 Tax=Arthrobacter sp. UYCu511 TaxID=3156337 RepID=UPI00339B9C65
MCGRKANKLSGGMQQRVAIARALAWRTRNSALFWYSPMVMPGSPDGPQVPACPWQPHRGCHTRAGTSSIRNTRVSPASAHNTRVTLNSFGAATPGKVLL